MKKLFTILLVLITSVCFAQLKHNRTLIVNGGGGSTIDTLPLSRRIDTNIVHIASNTSAIAGKENSLGNPSTNGYVLSSTTSGARSWVPNGSGSSGTVTSVGSGYGITGGAITTSGTLTLDSATVSNYYVRRKDSTISFITPTQNKLN